MKFLSANIKFKLAVLIISILSILLISAYIVFVNKQSNIPTLTYYTRGYEPDTFSLYQFRSILELKDISQFSKNTVIDVLDNTPNGNNILINENNTLSQLNIKNGEIRPILSAKNDQTLVSAKLSHDVNNIAYSIQLGEEVGATGEIYIYNILTKKSQLIYQESPLPLYGSIRILGWNKTNSKLIVQELGGDAGAFWGGMYTVETSAPYTKEEINIEKNDDVLRHFFTGTLSPDGEKWLYSYCANPTPPTAQEAESILDMVRPCPDGEDLFVYSFESKNQTPVYKNTSNDDNESKDSLRVIFSSAWQDNDHVIVSIPDGIFSANINNHLVSKLYEFQWDNPDDLNINASYILHASENYIIFDKMGGMNSLFVLTPKTKKILGIGQDIPFDFRGSPINGFIEF